jgi:hypothetical protein
MIKPPRWWFSKTLMGYGPGEDKNQRHIYDGDNKVCTLNRRMTDWAQEDEEALKLLVEHLNAKCP